MHPNNGVGTSLTTSAVHTVGLSNGAELQGMDMGGCPQVSIPTSPHPWAWIIWGLWVEEISLPPARCWNSPVKAVVILAAVFFSAYIAQRFGLHSI